MRDASIRLGVLLAIAATILIVGLVWLSRANDGPRLLGDLPEAPGLRVGAPVSFRGVSIGIVEDVAFTDSSVRVTIALRRDDLPLRRGDGVRMTHMGIFGDVALEIVPGPAGAPRVRDGDVLGAAPPDRTMLRREAAAESALVELARGARRPPPDTTRARRDSNAARAP